MGVGAGLVGLLLLANAGSALAGAARGGVQQRLIRQATAVSVSAVNASASVPSSATGTASASTPSASTNGTTTTPTSGNTTLSFDTSTCPGYALSALHETATGLTATLTLAGPACNAFGKDVPELVLEVVYESGTRLHVNIHDTANQQFTIPPDVFSPPTPSHGTSNSDSNSSASDSSSNSSADNEAKSELIFNHIPSPFQFWITRRSAPDAAPLFDTRLSSLPRTPLTAPGAEDGTGTAPAEVEGYGLVFEDQYLQLTSALPLGANVYGLGEVVSGSGIRRDVGENGGTGTTQVDWARDIADPVDENIYGVHPIYLEHRFDEKSGKSASHGVFLMSANGADILLLTPNATVAGSSSSTSTSTSASASSTAAAASSTLSASASTVSASAASPSSTGGTSTTDRAGSNGTDTRTSLIQYRLLGGTLSLYFLAGPTPVEVVEQYAGVVGTPAWQPVWGFGFQLCRWGYPSLNATKEVVRKMREAAIPLEVMWNDIDLYHAFRDFTADPVSFPAEGMREFVGELRANNQHYIPIVDAAIPKEINSTDVYNPYSKGTDLDVFIKNPDGTEYVGQVWPGFTVFPDWFAPNTLGWWTEALGNWSAEGVEFSGIWLDMNEASSFCDGSCGTGIDISNTSTPFILPGEPGNLVSEYPEGYNATISGPSGNITVNGTLTYGAGATAADAALVARGIGAGNQTGVELNTPPYAIHNANGRLSNHALATNATHAGGYVELDVHNLWGLMEAQATHKALKEVIPGKRPFIISRSAFASAGKWAGHWLGDNFSKWEYMYYSIQGVLQHQLFQIPFVGADTCGFNLNSDEELCNRWMQLAAFTPFYRNHNIKGAIPQEPFVWDSVAEASRKAIGVRYAMLPYWYSLFANASMKGTPPVRALFWEFPEEPELFAVDRQFLIGRDILVTPVLTPNVSTVDGIFPGRGKTIWRDWFTHDVLNASVGTNTTLSAPLGHINVHIRDGAAILLHHAPAYTTEETRQGPFALLVTQGPDGSAFGSSYLDDGVSDPPGPSTTVTVHATKGSVRIAGKGKFHVAQKLVEVTVLGVGKKPAAVLVGGRAAKFSYAAKQQKVVVTGLSVDLNNETTISWK